MSDILIGLAKGLKPYMGFVGTLLGALITMVSTGLADRRQDKRERRQFKEQEYLGVVDNVHAIKEGLRKLKANSVDQLYSRVNGSREDSEALDRRIRHADYVNELDLLRNQLDDFLTAIRKDLGYGRQ